MLGQVTPRISILIHIFTGRGIMNKKQNEPEDIESLKTLEEQEFAEEEAVSARLAQDIAEMQAELEKMKNDAQESHNRYLRTLADFDNFRKRQREDASRQVNLACEDILLKWLQIMDNFQRAALAAEEQHSYDSLVEGVSLTLKQMSELLEKEGVEPIESVGQEFNPELHEAMMRVETDEYPENTIIDEFEKGYTLRGRVVRPARVRVAVAP